ncbi:hypothetical protein QA644_24990 (plasmid) [Rhizobium sp. CC1099]|uniref:hypothetical protein n=1 Tax=Rhizobium sp. CC1099 TaxID=3039160 RepID=UPI0024B0A5FA|nr:hypothetical protein [Rhizobium sp. CC1099]WFU91417.1 hypothetical protein QA644_24990 [Rhizobium sp. CC1099]
MRSPWKFIAQLTSRRPLDNKSEESLDAAPEEKVAVPQRAVEEVESSPAPPIETGISRDDFPVESTETGAPPQTNGVPLTAEFPTGSEMTEASAEAEGQQDHLTDATLDQPPLTATKPSSLAAPKRRVVKPKSTQGKQQPVPTRGEPVAESRLPRVSPSDQMTGLDDDIRQLRAQLAEKLKLQNEHLKRMLDRFDRK